MTEFPDFHRWRRNLYAGTLWTFDPGETTGFSIWKDAQLIKSGQIETSKIPNNVKPLTNWIAKHSAYDTIDVSDRHLYPIKVVMEEYRIYGFKTDSHAWSTVHTIKLIGQLETLLTQWGIPYIFQGAGVAKTFADDEKLEAWGFWKRGEKHARDALRHAIYYYCTPEKVK